MYNPFAHQTCGIYAISGLYNGGYNGEAAYIGQSVNIGGRWNTHIFQLEHNKHGNQYLQSSWNKYGKENFAFIILETCQPAILDEMEKYLIKVNKTLAPNGFNLTPGGKVLRGKDNPSFGKKPSQETIRKMSDAKIGIKQSKEHIEKLRKARTGWKQKRESIDKTVIAKSKHYTFLNPQNEIVEIFNLAKFCREHPDKLHASAMRNVFKGRASHHKRWTKAP